MHRQLCGLLAGAEALYAYEGTREMNTLIVGKAIGVFSAFVRSASAAGRLAWNG